MLDKRIPYGSDDRYEVAANGCWIWRGAIGHKGYGRINRPGYSALAHRYMYEKHRGPIPGRLPLDHLCRTPACVNPDHLEPVTTAENTRRGNHTKLTPADVDDMRALLAIGASRKHLARIYGVTSQHIGRIVKERIAG